MNKTYISAKESAKLIRAQLKRHFPTTKFSVRTDNYAGGSSIDVRWVDGPSSKLVDPVIKQFQGGRFDGMIDMAYSADHWLLPDGTAVVASDPGTGDQRGSNPAERNWMPTPDAKLVHFSVNHIFSHREYTAAFLSRVIERLAAKGYPTEGCEVIESQFGGAYVQVARNVDHRGFDMEREINNARVRTHIAA